jgi:hypothetical protein
LFTKVLDIPVVREGLVRRLIWRLKTKNWLIHEIAMHEAFGNAEFDRAPIEKLESIDGFEDCYWLFSSNELNLGISQLRFDDAAYLYHHVRDLDHPRVAELGRYKGGTTFLLAAAGALVLSLELDRSIHSTYTEPMFHTLQHFGLSDRVDARLGDALTYDYGSNSFDLVLVHCSPPSYEITRKIVEHWWPAVSVGGHLVMHTSEFLPGEEKFVKEMSFTADSWHAVLETSVPGENVFFKKLKS